MLSDLSFSRGCVNIVERAMFISEKLLSKALLGKGDLPNQCFLCNAAHLGLGIINSRSNCSRLGSNETIRARATGRNWRPGCLRGPELGTDIE